MEANRHPKWIQKSINKKVQTQHRFLKVPGGAPRESTWGREASLPGNGAPSSHAFLMCKTKGWSPEGQMDQKRSNGRRSNVAKGSKGKKTRSSLRLVAPGGPADILPVLGGLEAWMF